MRSLLFCLVLTVLFAIPAASQQFDPHDLSGYWVVATDGHAFGTKAPALTPAGVEAMKGRIPEGVNKQQGNAPWHQCNPMGLPRIAFENRPIELIMSKDRVVELFQRDWTLREMWLDGRSLPSGENLDNLGPTWYGHSVAHWEGNTLVVNTTGLDERAWLDDNGNPKSFESRLEERYTRTGPDAIDFTLTLSDPKFYKGTWVSAKKTYKRLSTNDVTAAGWKSVYSGKSDPICAPISLGK
jgi:hypothetical protein